LVLAGQARGRKAGAGKRAGSNSKVALVTGSSSGIGYETSLALARSGYFTYASMRDPGGADLMPIARQEMLPLEVLQLDVTDELSVRSAVDRITKQSGRIDLLVNNAGYLLLGCLEDVPLAELKRQFETNFFGMVRVIQAVLPVMRKQKGGMIINVSSVAGRLGLPVASGYISTQFAIEGLSESIRYELEPFGIQVALVEPGMVRTKFLKPAAMADAGSPYHRMTRKLVDSIGKMAELGTSPEEVAKVIVKAANSNQVQTRYVVGNDAAMILESRRSMGDVEFENFIKGVILK
jgi:NAD(P)-dependent dehydrogenase (short-subunit alcohol dehydrogenase family)